MKKLTKSMRNWLLFLLLTTSATLVAQPCSVTFSWTNLPNGQVTFTATPSASTPSTTTYYWSFGNGQTYTNTGFAGMSATTTFTANGSYNVTLILMGVPGCSASVTNTIVVSNSTGCGLNAGFWYTQSLNGLVNFNNLTSGTTGGTSYSWNFGDNSAPSTVASPAHTYSANGSYTVTLIATENSTCISTYSAQVNVTGYCNLNASFIATNGSSGAVSFVSTSTGTTNSTTYFWQFGNGQQQVGSTVTHTYANGTYMATLTIMNSSVNPMCSDTAVAQIIVTNNPCVLVPSFTYTQGTNGQVMFTNTSAGTNSATTYFWNFMNTGFTSSMQNPTLTYPSGGNYNVVLTVNAGPNCVISTSQSVNITSIPCIANANFTLNPTSIPQFWTATPASPWNAAAMTWSWGDGNSSTTTYSASHQYSVAGMYNICLTVTATCGATATACNSYSIFKPSPGGAIINVNVVWPAIQNVEDIASTVGIINAQDLSGIYEVFPNPNTGAFRININGTTSKQVSLGIYNLAGEQIYHSTKNTVNGSVSNDVAIPNMASGVYFLQIKTDTGSITKKIVVEK